MTEAANNQEIQRVAEELIKTRSELVALESRISELKATFLDLGATGSIEWGNGKVSVIPASEISQLDIISLKQIVYENSLMSLADVEALFENGKVAKPKASYVSVRVK